MKKILTQLTKDKRSDLSLAAGALSVLATVFFIIMYLSTSYEVTEKPVVVITVALLAAVTALIGAYKNFFHVVNLASFILSVVALLVMVSGRVSYLAFYFSGDAMATGLSPMLVAAFVCALLAMIADAAAIFVEKK